MQEEIIEAVTKTEKYQEFISEDLSRFAVPERVGKENIYNPNNDGRYFVSFDLKKANYNALKFYHPDIVLGTSNYEEFIGRFVDLEYFKKAKHIRQVIFGNLNPKRQVKIQRYIISELLRVVSSYFPENRIKATTHDEIVVALERPEEYATNTEFKNALAKKVEDLGIELSESVFRLRQLKPFSYYVKEFCGDREKKVEFKMVPALFMPQVVKHYLGKDIEEYDLYFYHEGQIARFVTPISFTT